MKTNVTRYWKLFGKDSSEDLLPESSLESLLTSHLASAKEREARDLNKGAKQPESLFNILEPEEESDDEGITAGIIWATEVPGKDFAEVITVEDLRNGMIVPRVEKSVAEQNRRKKEKAEVFTPTWVCNLQNNLIDDTLVGEGAFNTIHKDNQKLWTPSESPVIFPEDYSWSDYVLSRRLEMTTGEGPYLMSPYDATTGIARPVRNSDGRFERIGILDRKLRVVTEQADNLKDWEVLAKIALNATYGYEWQGDNLVLARLNMVNTYFDYLVDFVRNKLETPEILDRKGFLKSRVDEIAEIASWQLWQMDGLKQVVPGSCLECEDCEKKQCEDHECPPKCDSCEKKLRVDHRGKLPVIKWGSSFVVFEDFLK